MKIKLPPSIGSFEDLLSIFDYDRELPLDIKEIGVEYRNGISIHDISYSSLANVKINAYLVVPFGKGPVLRRDFFTFCSREQVYLH